MSNPRRAYDDAASAAQMTSDCRVVEQTMRLPKRSSTAKSASQAARGPAPSIRYEDYPREMKKPAIAVSAAAARLAAALHLHLN